MHSTSFCVNMIQAVSRILLTLCMWHSDIPHCDMCVVACVRPWLNSI